MPRPDTVRRPALFVAVVCAATATLVHASADALVMLGAVTVVAGLLAGLAFVRHAVRHQRLTRALLALTRPGKLNGVEVRLGPVRNAAFVAGLVKPQIFCDERLVSTLDDEELRAVTFHEHAHQLARDPLRMALLAVAAPVMRKTRSGVALLQRLAAEREIAADRAALLWGASRASIASALLKVRPFEPAGAPGFSPAIDLRLRALLDEEPGTPQRTRRCRATLAGLGLATALCLQLLHSSSAVAATCC